MMFLGEAKLYLMFGRGTRSVDHLFFYHSIMSRLMFFKCIFGVIVVSRRVTEVSIKLISPPGTSIRLMTVLVKPTWSLSFIALTPKKKILWLTSAFSRFLALVQFHKHGRIVHGPWGCWHLSLALHSYTQLGLSEHYLRPSWLIPVSQIMHLM